VGSTLLMQFLASSPEVVLDRRYPHGEYRYLSYCSRAASFLTEPWRPGVDPGVTELFFGEARRFGPLPFEPESLELGDLERRALVHLWSAFSEAMLVQRPSARWYAEKLAVPAQPIIDAGIPLRLIDCVRDPRDVLVSIRAFTASTGMDGFGRRAEEPESQYLPRFIAAFAQQLDDMSATPASVDRITLRYEDFANEPHATANRLGEWLGLTIDPGVATRSPSEIPQHLTTASVEESIGRWKRGLAPDEADTIWERLGSRLEPYGYTQSLG
jgi:Sulfotransferase family